MIGILNYKMGNIKSVQNALAFLSYPSLLIDTPAQLAACDKLILPGVGAFALAMQELRQAGFVESLKQFVTSGKPLLGICLGMQLLLDSSEEHGHHQGLGLIKGAVLPFDKKISNLPIPHVGWNNIRINQKSKLLEGVETDESFYFVHSYYCEVTDRLEVLATTDYGLDFDSIIQAGNVYGCQFHPEKSQGAGLKLLDNFCKNA